MRLDLHLHTVGSRDCLTDPEAVLARSVELGLDRIAITDHDRLHVGRAMAERYPERVIPGEEVKTAEGVDIIGLYLREEIAGGTPARETCRRIRAQGGIVYLPHPFARGKGGSGRLTEVLAPFVDVVEVFNGRLRPAGLNRKAEGFARAHGIPRGAGSDAHTLRELAGCWVEVPSHPNEPGALLEALAHGRIHGRTAPAWVHLGSVWAKARKVLPRPPRWRPENGAFGGGDGDRGSGPDPEEDSRDGRSAGSGRGSETRRMGRKGSQ